MTLNNTGRHNNERLQPFIRVSSGYAQFLARYNVKKKNKTFFVLRAEMFLLTEESKFMTMASWNNALHGDAIIFISLFS